MPSKKGKVTAIISSYCVDNEYFPWHMQFLRERLINLTRSVKDPPDEIIIVAKRDSGDVLAAGWIDDKRVRLITTDDVPTLYAAWNMAIGKATGDYITNTNVDDKFNANGLLQLRKILDNNPDVAVAYGDQVVIDINGDLTLNSTRWAHANIKTLAEGCCVGPMPLWRKSLHDKHGYFDDTFTSAGDYEFWLRIAAKGEKFKKYTDVPVGFYRSHDFNLEHRKKTLSAWEAGKARSKWLMS